MAARSETVEKDAAAERLSSAELLLDALNELDERYRSVLRARYLEQRSVAEVARALRASSATVETWTRRGIERLRAILERRAGTARGDWALVVLPLTASEETPPPILLGAPAQLAVVGALAGAGVVAGLAFWLSRPSGERADLAAAAGAPVEPWIDAPAAAGERTLRRAAPDPGTGAQASGGTSAVPASPESRRSKRVRVENASGREIEGATVILSDQMNTELARARAGGDGSARFEVDVSDLGPIEGIPSPHPLIQVHAGAPGLALSETHVVPLPPAGASRPTISSLGCTRCASSSPASGSASASAGDLVLGGTQLRPNQPGLYFQGSAQVNGGAGVAFGDGLRCAGGSVVRLQVVSSNASGTSSTSIDLGATGGVSPGEVRTYQLWYRDPAGSPCGTGFNLTNGLELVWQP